MHDLKQYLHDHRDKHLGELFDLLRIPSVSTDPAHKGDVRQAAQWVCDQLSQAGLEAALYETGGHPMVYGQWLSAGEGAPTVLVYGHYDVQPPDPLDLWVSGPFEPTVRDGKIFARGATDDKGQMFAWLKAAEVHMKTRGALPLNLKVMIEGEEEVGSKHLAPWIEAHKALLAADAVVISDTSMFAPGLPAIVYGLRGLTYFQVDVEGPDHDLHSGLYGGAVVNPINALCQMIAALKDEQGRVAVPGFYDKVRDLTVTERAAWAALPHDDEALRLSVGAAALDGESGFTALERTWGRPTLDCNGILGGFTGEGAKTVLPSKAMAKFSCRLVPDQTPEEIEDLVEAHLLALAPAGVRVKVHRLHGGRPVIVDVENPAVQAAREALSVAFGAEAVNIRGGGSIPVVADFHDLLQVPCVLMGFGLNDDRLHSPNEKYNLECFHGGLLAATLFLDRYAAR
jgi:acetylornithine deacetylase/succinyl-diaminopimelate desuccinylase-like protein